MGNARGAHYEDLDLYWNAYGYNGRRLRSDDLPPGVPEIDAFAGLAAMGVVGSIAALIWERRRRK